MCDNIALKYEIYRLQRIAFYYFNIVILPRKLADSFWQPQGQLVSIVIVFQDFYYVVDYCGFVDKVFAWNFIIYESEILMEFFSAVTIDSIRTSRSD